MSIGRLLLAVVAILALSVGIGVRAQDASTPEALATPDTALCATPLAEGDGATPAVTAAAPDTAATPGNVDTGTPVGLFPCGTPVDPVASPAVADAGTTGDTAGATSPAVVMVDIAFQPTEITIPANTDVTIQLTNNGVAIHNFVVDELSINSGDFTSGQAGSVTVNAPAGSYQYYCSVPGHKEIGMVGTLTVQ